MNSHPYQINHIHLATLIEFIGTLVILYIPTYTNLGNRHNKENLTKQMSPQQPQKLNQTPQKYPTAMIPKITNHPFVNPHQASAVTVSIPLPLTRGEDNPSHDPSC